MQEPLLQTIAAAQGTFIVNNTSEKTVDFDALQVCEDTVISSLKIGGVEKKTEYIADTAGTLKAGTIIRPNGVEKFSAVTLTSGSVVLVL